MKRRIRYYVWSLVRYVFQKFQESKEPFPHFLAQQTRIQSRIAELKRELAARVPDHPALYGFKVYSQADEDGIIEHLLNKLPHELETRCFIEIGCGDGLENNTHYMLLKGYRGIWVDGMENNIRSIQTALGDVQPEQRLLLSRVFVDLDNISDLAAAWIAFLGTPDIDFLSIDIDGNDAHLLESALEYLRPKIICVEYNAKFPPTLAIAMNYDKNHRWPGDDYQGASLLYCANILDGYHLVACNLAGTNAFFVRSDFSNLFASHSLEQLYQPFRHELCLQQPGHPATFKWLRDAIYRQAVPRL